jgi:hypothetical protein
MSTFCSYIAGRATNNDGVAVPWGAIAADPNKYLEASQVAVGVNIREPSKMSAVEVRSIYEFWLKRQKKKMEVFRFKSVDPTHVRVPYGKRKRNLNWENMSWMDVSDGEDFDLSETERAERNSGNRKGKGR